MSQKTCLGFSAEFKKMPLAIQWFLVEFSVKITFLRGYREFICEIAYYCHFRFVVAKRIVVLFILHYVLAC